MRRRRYQQPAQTFRDRIRDLSDADLLKEYRSTGEMNRTPERDQLGQVRRGERRHLALLQRRTEELREEIQRRGLSLYATTEEGL